MVTTNLGRHQAFQCGIPFVGKILWLEWSPGVVGLSASGNLRVFIHSQVLEKYLLQMRTQLGNKEGIAYSCLCASLARPTVLRSSRTSERAFVDLRVCGSVVGNFAFSIHQEIALIDYFELVPQKCPNQLRALVRTNNPETIISKSMLASFIPEVV